MNCDTSSFDKHFQDSRKHVTFSDQSESDYSTNTPNDEEDLKKKLILAPEQTYEIIMSHGTQQKVDVNQNFSKMQPFLVSPQSTASNIDKLYQFCHEPKAQLAHPSIRKSLPPPVGNSPVYYDPLHLRNVGSNFSPGDMENGCDLDRSDAYQYQVKGILKKNSSSSNQNLSLPIDDFSGLRQINSADIVQAPASCNPVMIPPLNLSEDQLSSSLQDPNRVSAFTPVTSRKKLPQTNDDFGFEDFSPVKGPAVLDFVRLSASPMNSHDVLALKKSNQDSPPAAPTYYSYTPPHFYDSLTQHGTPSDQTSHQFSAPPSHHSTPPHHETSHQYSTPLSHHSTPSNHHLKTTNQFSTPPSHHSSTPPHRQSKPSHQYPKPNQSISTHQIQNTSQYPHHSLSPHHNPMSHKHQPTSHQQLSPLDLNLKIPQQNSSLSKKKTTFLM